MTTIDDYSELIGYDVVAQRRKSRDPNNNQYCPGIIANVSPHSSNKLIIKFGDNEKSEIPSSNLYINDPDDISESNKYWLNMSLIYSKNTSVLADLEYSSDNSNYQYGKILNYNQTSNTCDIVFNKFGQINNIPTSSIITSCDNRYITGVKKKENIFLLEESETIESERNCKPIKSIDNLGTDKKLVSGNISKEVTYTNTFSYFKYYLLLNLITLGLTVLTIFSNFNRVYITFFNILKSKFINYLIIFLWSFLISFSLGPILFVYWIITQTLELFNYHFPFDLNIYLSGKCLFQCSAYIPFLLIILGLNLYLIVKAFKSSKDSTEVSSDSDNSDSDDTDNSSDDTDNSSDDTDNSSDDTDNSPIVPQPSIDDLGKSFSCL